MPQARKVVRQAGLETQDVAGFGVLEAQYMGVQGLSAKGLQRLAAVLAQVHRLGLEAGAPRVVAKQRMAQMSQMDADLMGPAGLQPAGEQARDRFAIDSGVFLQKLPMGHGFAAVWPDRLLVAGLGVAPEWGVD